MADSTKDHDTSLALAQAVMLTNDIVNLTVDDSEEIRELLTWLLLRRLRMPALRLLPKPKAKLLVLELRGTMPCMSLLNSQRQVDELRHGIYVEEWLACLTIRQPKRVGGEEDGAGKGFELGSAAVGETVEEGGDTS
ncbi:hypothetical protein Acr_18g0009170 [Actinidia rufa]|uniref:Uncharacterized protein n=1 Tax=Actinidia rufa TaxID=165716 RepID=A0A7J0G7I3_9ERIC|nr:hypothetical protein Acr_18g0009170 [Actinidia rufa]